MSWYVYSCLDAFSCKAKFFWESDVEQGKALVHPIELDKRWYSQAITSMLHLVFGWSHLLCSSQSAYFYTTVCIVPTSIAWPKHSDSLSSLDSFGTNTSSRSTLDMIFEVCWDWSQDTIHFQAYYQWLAVTLSSYCPIIPMLIQVVLVEITFICGHIAM